MEDDTGSGYKEDLKNDFGIDLLGEQKTQYPPTKPETENVENSPSISPWPNEKSNSDAANSSEERKRFLLERHEKLTIENENLKKELEEIKLRIQSFRAPEHKEPTPDD